VCFDGEKPPVVVSVTSGASGSQASWTLIDDFTAAGPADTVFTFDSAAATLQFGNGVNGMIPASGSRITVTYRTSQGAISNIAGGLEWEVPALGGGVYGLNLDPVTGGADAEQLPDLQARARSACTLQPVVTDDDLLAAAHALTGLRLARAEIAPMGTFPPSVRTLVAMRERDADAAVRSIPESPAWLEAVRHALWMQLTLGQRLRVIAPRYVPIGLHVAVSAGPDADSSAMAGQIALALQARFALLAGAAGVPPWPLGAAVAVQSIRGWIRALPGVLAVTSVELTSGSGTLTSGELSLPATGLPELSIAASDVSVTRTATGSRR
jgi:predicted phage baseplate assembly protein